MIMLTRNLGKYLVVAIASIIAFAMSDEVVSEPSVSRDDAYRDILAIEGKDYSEINESNEIFRTFANYISVISTKQIAYFNYVPSAYEIEMNDTSEVSYFELKLGYSIPITSMLSSEAISESNKNKLKNYNAKLSLVSSKEEYTVIKSASLKKLLELPYETNSIVLSSNEIKILCDDWMTESESSPKLIYRCKFKLEIHDADGDQNLVYFLSKLTEPIFTYGYYNPCNLENEITDCVVLKSSYYTANIDFPSQYAEPMKEFTAKIKIFDINPAASTESKISYRVEGIKTVLLYKNSTLASSDFREVIILGSSFSIDEFTLIIEFDEENLFYNESVNIEDRQLKLICDIRVEHLPKNDYNNYVIYGHTFSVPISIANLLLHRNTRSYTLIATYFLVGLICVGIIIYLLGKSRKQKSIMADYEPCVSDENAKNTSSKLDFSVLGLFKKYGRPDNLAEDDLDCEINTLTDTKRK